MSPFTSRYGLYWTDHKLSDQLLAFAFALLLPVLSSVLTAHSHTLQTIPFGLYFISIAVIALLGGIAPALLGVFFCVVARHYFLTPGEQLLAVNTDGIYRLTALVVDAVLISTIDRRRRISATRLLRALRQLEERSSSLMDALHASKCASWVHDIDLGTGTKWYSGSYEIFGRPFDEIESLGSLISLLHVDDQARLSELIALMKTSHEPIHWDFRAAWPNGDMHSFEMRANRVPGERRIWRGLTVDITDRKQAESALLRSEKLAAMGRLASTVAHEINNPLESVTNLLYLARADTTLSPDTHTYLATAEQELARLGDITRLTLGFVRSSSIQSTLLAEGVVEDVLKIFRHRLETRNIRVERSYEPDVEVYIAAHELRQIVTNLISNSVDALSGTGLRIAVTISRRAECIAIVIEDNGGGIPQAQLQRIFDPFFTTKDDVGTGIGLWVTRELIERNGGSVAVESGELANGMRTRFRIELPPAA